MKRNKRHTQIALNLTENCERFVPQKIKTCVNQDYTIEGALCCPFIMLSFLALGKKPTYAHIVPKCEQSVLTQKQDVVNHPANLVPTIDIIHEQMELHQSIPGFTLDLVGAHQLAGKDIYTVRMAPHITGKHLLLNFLVNGKEVVMPAASRQFWHIHRQVFDLCQQAKAQAGNAQGMELLLNTVLFNLVVNHISLPMIQRVARESLKERRKSPSFDSNALLSQPKPSFAAAAAELLAKRNFELKSSWFSLDPNNGPPPEYYKIYILWQDCGRKSFDITSRQDFVHQSEYDELIRTYKGRCIKKFKNVVYTIPFDDLLNHLRPGSLSTLQNRWSPADCLPSSSGDNSAAAFHEGAVLSRKKHRILQGGKSPEKARALKQRSVVSGTDDTPIVDTPKRKRKGRLAVEENGRFKMGTTITVPSRAKAYAGKVCTVQHVEHVLEGNREVQMVYLKHCDASKEFKLPASFLEHLDSFPVDIHSETNGDHGPQCGSSNEEDVDVSRMESDDSDDDE